MSCRFRLLCAASLFLLPVVAQAQDAKTPAPSVLARFASLDDLLDQVEYVAKLVGQEEEAKQVVGFFKAARGAKGIDGIDTKRPIAFYAGTPEGLSIPFYLMIPIADEKTLVEDGFGKRLRIELKKESDTVKFFEIPNLPVKVFVKFANGYAYFTALDAGSLEDKKLPDPKVIGNDRTSLVSLSVRLDQLPEQIKLFVLGQVETMAVAAKKKDATGESKAEIIGRNAGVDLVVGAFKAFLLETKELAFNLKIDPKAEELAAEWNLIPVEGTKLSKDLASLQAPKNIFGGLATKNTLFRATSYLSLPGSLRKAFQEIIEESFAEAMKNVPGEFDDLAKSIVEAVKPTLTAGEWDAGVAVMGPDKTGHLSFLVGHRLVKGEAIDQVFRTVTKNLPEGLNNFIELDAAKGGKSGIHKMDVSQLINEDLQKVLSKETHIWLAFADDRHLLYVGPDGKEQLKNALETPATGAKLLEMSLSVGRLAPYYNLEKAEAMKAVAETIFGKDYKNDTVTMSLEGGKSLKWKLQIPGKVLTFIGALRGAE